MKTDSWGSKTCTYYFTVAAARDGRENSSICGWDASMPLESRTWTAPERRRRTMKLLQYSDGASHKATRTESEKRHGLGTRMSITMSKSTDSLTRRGTNIEGNMVLAHFVEFPPANDRYKP